MTIPRGTFNDYLLVVRRPQAAAFLSASLVSGAGSALTAIAVPIAVYQMTSSLAALGTTWVVRIVVSFATLPLAGVVADRYDRRKTMVVSNYASILADGLMLLGFIAPDLRLLMAGLAILQAANRFHGPASAALFPRFFAPDELPVANSAKTAVGQAVSLAAPALGGLLAHGWGIVPLFILDAVSFLVAA
ncbi:MAG: MFS transporter, partial [Bacillota bacterium]